MGADPIKYEIDKVSGMLRVDRFMQVAMHYPCNYGFVPNTCAGDGDPLDILIITSYPLMAGSMISTRAIGVLLMEDEAGPDEKIVALPTKKVAPEWAHIEHIDALNTCLKERILHFFCHYKDLEPGKWVKAEHFAGQEKAFALLNQSAQAMKAPHV